jgi:hypothetical protein
MDGVGIGKKDYEHNPFYKYGFKTFSKLFGEIPNLEKQRLSSNGSYLFPVDACMGIPDIPLSGTGQTSIFCGVNASKIIGKHFGPYPYSTLIPIIQKQNIFNEFKKKKLKVNFVNAYPKIFFDYINSGRRRLSVTTLSCLLSNVRLHKIADIHRRRALSAEINNSRLVERLKYKLPIISSEVAGRRLLNVASKNHLTVFEIFHTDHLGHGRNADLLASFIKTLDDFLYYLIINKTRNMTLIICSDHGNFEDLSTKMHTLNPALGIVSGKYSNIIYNKIKRLDNIKPSIMEMYD